jgi:hypothetical protein
MLRIVVIDGQGGGIGSAIIRKVKETYGESVELVALGTNAIATSAMMKARANKGATGENAIIQNVRQADLIIGPLSIVMANSLMGELTPKMAEAIASSRAHKILFPLFQEDLSLVGVRGQPFPHLLEALIREELDERISHV